MSQVNDYAGKITKVSGTSYIERNGERIEIAPGDQIFSTDKIITSSSSSVQVEFADGAIADLSPNTTLAVQDFEFGAGEDPSFILNLTQGIMRSVSGEVVKQNPDAFKIVTPSATVGIRGTELLTAVRGTNEVHAVLHIDQGHNVLVTTFDGRQVSLISARQGTEINPQTVTPLTIETFTEEELTDFVNIINEYLAGALEEELGSEYQAGDSIIILLDAEVLNNLTQEQQEELTEFLENLGITAVVESSDDADSDEEEVALAPESNENEILDQNNDTDDIFPVITSSNVLGSTNALSPNGVGGANPNDVFAGNLVASATMTASHADNETLSFAVQNQNGTYGTLTIDASTGLYEYTIESSRAATKALAEGEQVQDIFIISVTDQSGNTTNTTVTVNIEGTNDLPEVNTTNQAVLNPSMTAGNPVISGVVEFDDVDGSTLTITQVTGASFDTEFGTVTIQQIRSVDGAARYAYDLDETNPTVQALGMGQILYDDFTIRAMDNNGAYVDQVITVSIPGTNLIPLIDNTNSDLELQTAENSMATADTGQIVFTSMENLNGGKITVGGTTFTVTENPAGTFTLSGANLTIAGTHGELTITGLTYNGSEFTLNYSYTQNTAFDHQGQTNAEIDSFDVEIQDSVEAAGNPGSAKATINVNSTDDAPSVTAPADTQYSQVGQAINGTFTISPGADGVIPADVEFSVKIGGVDYTQPLANIGLTVNTTTGAYTFNPVQGIEGDVEITLKVTDGDGTEASDSVTIADNLFGDGSTLSGAVSSADNNMAVDSIVTGVTLPAGTTIQNGSYTAFASNGNELGTFEIQNGNLVFTQNTAFEHNLNSDSYTETVQVPVSDGNGSGNISVSVTITDGGPSITDVTDTSYTALNQSISGDFNILSGVDSNGATIEVSVNINGQNISVTPNGTEQNLGVFGKITFNVDGSYIFTPQAGIVGDVTITATVTDGDGDQASESTIITDNLFGNGTAINSSILTGLDESVNIATPATINIGAGIELSSIVINGTTINFDINGDVTGANSSINVDFGTLSGFAYDTTSGALSFNYTQTSAFTHSDTSRHNETADITSYEIIFTDTDGNSPAIKPQITIKITDDGPSITSIDSLTAIKGNTTHGTITANFGGDGLSSSEAYSVKNATYDTVNNRYELTNGYVSFDGAGGYSYTAKASAVTGTEDFTIVIKDGDGDIAELATSVNILSQVSGAVYDVILKESDITSGTDAGGGENIIYWDIPQGYTINAADSNIFQNSTPVGTVTHDAANNRLIITLTDKVQGDGSNQSTLIDPLNITLLDTNTSNIITLDVNIAVQEDSPIITGTDVAFPIASEIVINEANIGSSQLSVSSSGTTIQEAFEDATNINFNFGADGQGTITSTNYNLSLVNNGQYVDSGLTSHGIKILLNKVGDNIEGTANGELIFTIKVENENITLIHEPGKGIDHINGDPKNIGAGKIFLNATVEISDNDGDKTSDELSMDIGENIVFNDGTPTISQSPIFNLTEALGGPQGSTAQTVNLDFGVDGQASGGAFSWHEPGGDIYSGGLTLTWTTNNNVLSGSTANGEVIRMTAEQDSNGNYTGKFTVELFEGIDNSSNPLEIKTNFTITDHDGNFDTEELIINITDGGISITNQQGESHELILENDESINLFSGIATSQQLKNALGTDIDTITIGGLNFTAGTANVSNLDNGIITFDPSVDNAQLTWVESANGSGVGIKNDNDNNSFVGDHDTNAQTSEVLIITLPNNEQAQGIELNFEQLFNGETAIVQFYDSAGLPITADINTGQKYFEVHGTSSGHLNIVFNVVSFTEIRIIPKDANSDFVLSSADISNFSDAIIGKAEGKIATEGVDALDFVYLSEFTMTHSSGASDTITFNETNGNITANPPGFTNLFANLSLSVGANNSQVIEITGVDADKYFTITVNQDGTWEVLHYEKGFSLDISFVAKDIDGSTDTHQISIDDNPAPYIVNPFIDISGVADLTVDEANNILAETSLSTTDFADTIENIAATGNLSSDSATVTATNYYLSITDTDTNLVSNGVNISLEQTSDGKILGVANGISVFEISVDSSSGEVSLTLFAGQSITNNGATTKLGTDQILLNAKVTIEENGITVNEEVSVDIGDKLNFNDAGPDIINNELDPANTKLLTAGSSVAFDSTTFNFKDFYENNTEINYGSDGASATDSIVANNFTLSLEGLGPIDSGLTSGTNIVFLGLANDGSEIRGTAHGQPVFTIFVDNATGVVTLTQYETVDGVNTADVFLSINKAILNAEITLTDGDGTIRTEDVTIDLGDVIGFTGGNTINIVELTKDLNTSSGQDSHTTTGLADFINIGSTAGAYTVDASGGNDTIIVETLGDGVDFATITAGVGADNITVTNLVSGTINADDGKDDNELDNIIVTNMSGGAINSWSSDTINISSMEAGTVLAGGAVVTANIKSSAGTNHFTNLGSGSVITSTSSSAHNNNLILDGADNTTINLTNFSDLDISLQSEIKNSNINFKGGNDELALTTRLTSLDGSIIDLGSGHDTVQLQSNILSNATLNLGEGNDVVNIQQDSTGASTNINTGTINFGSGDDTLNINNGGTLSGGTIDFGTGNDNLNVENGGTLNTNINLGDGNNYVQLKSGSSYNNAQISMEDGDDRVEIGVAIGSGADGLNEIDLGNGNNELILTASLGEHTTVNFGTGNDSLSIGALGVLNYGSETLNLGEGNDSFIIKNEMNVGQFTNGTVNLGAGEDTFTLEHNVGFAATARVELDAGNDIVNIYSNYDGSIDAGSGDNTINLNYASAVLGSINNINLDLTNGNNTLNINSSVSFHDDLTFGDGSDTINVYGTLFDDAALSDANIALGNGQNQVIVHDSGRINNTGTISFGTDSDTLLIKAGAELDFNNGTLNLGDGTDTFTLENGAIFSSGTVDLGADNDTVNISDNFDGRIRTGLGTNNINFVSVAGIGLLTIQNYDLDLSLGNNTITIGDNVTLSNTAASGSISLGDASNTFVVEDGGIIDLGNNKGLTFGTGIDSLIINEGGSLANGEIIFGDGADTFTLNGEMSGGEVTIEADDIFNMGDNASLLGGTINYNKGGSLSIAQGVEGNGTINFGTATDFTYGSSSKLDTIFQADINGSAGNDDVRMYATMVGGTISLGEGNDQFDLYGTMATADVIVELGGGSDLFYIKDTGRMNAGFVDLGDGTNHFYLNLSNGGNGVLAGGQIIFGANNDTFTILQNGLMEDGTVNLGNGTNNFNVAGGSITGGQITFGDNNDKLNITNNFDNHRLTAIEDGTYNFGAGNDEFDLSAISSESRVSVNDGTFNFGAGQDRMDVNAHAYIRGGDFNFNADNIGDIVTIAENGTINSTNEDINITFGAGNDEFTVNGRLGKANIDFGDGDNELTVTNTSSTKAEIYNTNINFGSGVDSFTIGNNAIMESGTIDLGAGNNIFTIAEGGELKGGTVDLGSGSNTFNLDGAWTGGEVLNIGADDTINLGENSVFSGTLDLTGTPTFTVKGTIGENGKLIFGDEDNTVTLQKDLPGTIDLGGGTTGDDDKGNKVIVTDGIDISGQILGADGNDIIGTEDDRIADISGTINLGNGDNEVYADNILTGASYLGGSGQDKIFLSNDNENVDNILAGTVNLGDGANEFHADIIAKGGSYIGGSGQDKILLDDDANNQNDILGTVRLGNGDNEVIADNLNGEIYGGTGKEVIKLTRLDGGDNGIIYLNNNNGSDSSADEVIIEERSNASQELYIYDFDINEDKIVVNGTELDMSNLTANTSGGGYSYVDNNLATIYINWS